MRTGCTLGCYQILTGCSTFALNPCWHCLAGSPVSSIIVIMDHYKTFDGRKAVRDIVDIRVCTCMNSWARW